MKTQCIIKCIKMKVLTTIQAYRKISIIANPYTFSLLKKLPEGIYHNQQPCNNINYRL